MPDIENIQEDISHREKKLHGSISRPRRKEKF
jgi:hypothetical protein